MNTLLQEQHTWRVFQDIEKEDMLRGKHGVIHQRSDGSLDIWVQNVRVACRIEKEGWMAQNHYDDGALFIRPFDDLNRAARYLKARRMRVVTEAMRQKGRELAARMRLRKENPLLGTITGRQN